MQPEDIVHISQVTNRKGENYLLQQAADELDRFVPKMKSNEIKSTTTGDLPDAAVQVLIAKFYKSEKMSLSQIHGRSSW